VRRESMRHDTCFRVASGVESIVLGDVPLLGQLRAAYATAQAHQTTGPLLNRLCQCRTPHAGKRCASRDRNRERRGFDGCGPPSSSPRDTQVAWRCGAS
jgi:hypothetical protein